MYGVKKIKQNIPAILVAAVILLIWQIAAMIINMDHILPGPVQIVVRIWELRESLFLHHLPVTLLTVLSGWFLSVLIGTLLAIVMYESKLIDAMIRPVLVITQTIPVMCISPLFVIWLGYTLQARLLAVVLSTFFSITLNTLDGLKGTDYKKIELMKTYGASRWQIFCRLELKSALPKFMTALKMTIPWAVIDAAVAEWLGATEGLGYFSKRMVSKMDGAGVFAPIVILCVIALLGMAIIKYFDRRFAYYRNEL